MHHATLDGSVREHWHSALSMLQARAGVDYSLLRRLGPRGSDIVSAYPSPVPDVLSDEGRDSTDDRFMGRVLASGVALGVPDTEVDARWDAINERRAGFRAYWGEPLYWPDREPFGCLELLSYETVAADAAEAIPSLLSCVATGIRAQLEVLHLRRDQNEGPLHDPMTGLAGQRLFREFTINQIQRSVRSGAQLWMLQWQIDGFDRLRDQVGAPESDALLRGCAEGARSCVRRSDILARLGPNRFAMLIGDANEFAATAVADRIRRTLRRMPAPDGQKLTISCGLSPHQVEEDAESWEARTGAAMDQATAGGRDRTVVRLHA